MSGIRKPRGARADGGCLGDDITAHACGFCPATCVSQAAGARPSGYAPRCTTTAVHAVASGFGLCMWAVREAAGVASSAAKELDRFCLDDF